MKRLFDIVFVLLLLALTWPLLLLVFISVRTNLGSPALFRQDRPGLHGQVFTMVKFRSMRSDRDEKGELLADEFRMTKFGNFLRKSSLDELPELINVLKGEMSLVGPRPLLVEYLPLYNDEQKKRHDVRPGITGWAQVNGRNAISWEKKFEMDVWYVENRSFWLDLKILFMTIWKVVKKSDISAEGQVTAEKFTGSES